MLLELSTPSVGNAGARVVKLANGDSGWRAGTRNSAVHAATCLAHHRSARGLTRGAMASGCEHGEWIEGSEFAWGVASLRVD